jgi:hypothetical protein
MAIKEKLVALMGEPDKAGRAIGEKKKMIAQYKAAQIAKPLPSKPTKSDKINPKAKYGDRPGEMRPEDIEKPTRRTEVAKRDSWDYSKDGNYIDVTLGKEKLNRDLKKVGKPPTQAHASDLILRDKLRSMKVPKALVGKKK